MEERASKVLVIDDNEANRTLAKATLEDEGYEVLLASGGLAGLAAFEGNHPDCVLLDVRMPDLDGFAVCQRIRAMPRGQDTPILFLTALRDVDTFDRAQLAGGDEFLTKPIRPTELVVRVEAALKLRRLTAEVRTHYELLKHQRDALVRLQLQKERLTAFVVHDLKNPVNAMDLHAQLLLREKGLSASAYESAAQIRTEARQLNRMILNLLDLAKADEGRLQPRRARLDLRALVDDVLVELAVNAQAQDVVLRAALAEKHVYADEDLLRRTLANLVDNAIRYAPPATEVTVTSACVESETVIRVSDEGSGIPEAMREKIFEAFTQVEDPTGPSSRGGRGLGLTFCKLVVLAHGGTIRVGDASPGAVFIVRLPNEA